MKTTRSTRFAVVFLLVVPPLAAVRAEDTIILPPGRTKTLKHKPPKEVIRVGGPRKERPTRKLPPPVFVGAAFEPNDRRVTAKLLNDEIELVASRNAGGHEYLLTVEQYRGHPSDLERLRRRGAPVKTTKLRYKVFVPLASVPLQLLEVEESTTVPLGGTAARLKRAERKSPDGSCSLEVFSGNRVQLSGHKRGSCVFRLRYKLGDTFLVVEVPVKIVERKREIPVNVKSDGAVTFDAEKISVELGLDDGHFVKTFSPPASVLATVRQSPKKLAIHGGKRGSGRAIVMFRGTPNVLGRRGNEKPEDVYLVFRIKVGAGAAPRGRRERAVDDNAPAPSIRVDPGALVLPKPAAIPVPLSQKSSRKTIRSLYKPDFADGSIPGKRRLASRLLQQSLEERDPSLLYVLLDEARRLALESGALELALTATNRLATNFRGDTLSVRAAALASWSKHAKSTADATLLADAYFQLIADAARAGHPAAMDKIRLKLSKVVSATKSKSLIAQAKQAKKYISRFRSGHKRYLAALEKLDGDPMDADAHLDAGEYLCFIRGDWENGLKHLRSSSDDRLASMASIVPSSAENRRRLAEGWAEIGLRARSTPKKEQVLAYAGMCYERARRDLKGIAGKKLDARMAEIERQEFDFVPNLPTSGGLQFDGREAHVRVASLRFDGSSPFVLEAVVRPEGSPDRTQTIFGDARNNRGLVLGLKGAHWRFTVRGETDSASARSDRRAIPNRRVHLTGVFDGRRTLLFVDGVLQRDSGVLESEYAESQRGFFVGADPAANETAEHFFRGSIYELRASRSIRYRSTFSSSETASVGWRHASSVAHGRA